MSVRCPLPSVLLNPMQVEGEVTIFTKWGGYSYREKGGSALYQQKEGSHSFSLLRLVVELFLGLQHQNIVLKARHIPGCLNITAAHLSWPN